MSFCSPPVALTSQPAQGRCPGGSGEQAQRREQGQRRRASTHRDSAPALVQEGGGGPSDLISVACRRPGLLVSAATHPDPAPGFRRLFSEFKEAPSSVRAADEEVAGYF